MVSRYAVALLWVKTVPLEIRKNVNTSLFEKKHLIWT